MNHKNLVAIGNFGIEHVKIGQVKDSFPGGAGFRFALFASLYLSSMKIISIIGQEQPWKEALDILDENGVDITDIVQIKGGINFFTFYDDDRNLQKFRIVNTSVMKEIARQNVEMSVDNQTIFHICPFDYDSQAKLVAKANQKNAYVSLQIHHSSINDDTRLKYLELFKSTDLLFMTDGEAALLTQCKPTNEAGCLLSTAARDCVFITRGEKGVSVFKKGQKLFDAGSVPVQNPANVEGAGDAFAAGVISGLIKTNDIRKATILGLITAGLSIQFESTRDVIEFVKETIYGKK